MNVLLEYNTYKYVCYYNCTLKIICLWVLLAGHFMPSDHTHLHPRIHTQIHIHTHVRMNTITHAHITRAHIQT